MTDPTVPTFREALDDILAIERDYDVHADSALSDLLMWEVDMADLIHEGAKLGMDERTVMAIYNEERTR